MKNLKEFAEKKIAELKSKNLFRETVTSNRFEFPEIVRHDQKMISFACNDYLGLSTHPKVIHAAMEATNKYGAGAGASRLITGNHPLYNGLESALAAHHKKPATAIFGSGYLANIGIIQALCNDKTLIVADKLVHACIIDGARLSGAKLMRFSHNNMQHLQEILVQHRQNYELCFVITETIFSMDGDLAPLQSMRNICNNYQSFLMTDSAHNITHDDSHADIVVGTLSKALGSYGGYVCADSSVIAYLKSAARSFIFSTGLPPAAIASAHAALNIMEGDESLTQQPHLNASTFVAALPDIFGSSPPHSHIIPIIIGDEGETLQSAQKLANHGFYVPAIRPPTVPSGTSRLRLSFSSSHSHADICNLAEAIKALSILHLH